MAPFNQINPNTLCGFPLAYNPDSRFVWNIKQRRKSKSAAAVVAATETSPEMGNNATLL